MPLGAGTERIVAAVRRLTAQVWRFDSDVVKPGLDPAALLSPFRERGGILVATTMILPYLESLHPDAVAVVRADRLLHRPEYRAAERALALLRNVGSAARAPVLVETADPMHPSIQAALAPSLQPFYLEELEVRRALGYPPFRSLAVLTVTGNTAAALAAVATRLAAAATSGVEVLGPTPRLQPEAHGRTVRSEFVIKFDNRAALRPLILPLLLGEGIPRSVSVAVDVDPHDL
jgi:primosomal protein N' (replication factor Y)